MLKQGDLVINIVDATNLERNLYLTMELVERNIPVIVALNMWDDTGHKGIEIDVKRLEEILGVPVVPTCGLTGAGIKELVSRLGEVRRAGERLPDEKLPTMEETLLQRRRIQLQRERRGNTH